MHTASGKEKQDQIDFRRAFKVYQAFSHHRSHIFLLYIQASANTELSSHKYMGKSALAMTHHFFDFNLGAGFRGIRNKALMGCISHSAKG